MKLGQKFKLKEPFANGQEVKVIIDRIEGEIIYTVPENFYTKLSLGYETKPIPVSVYDSHQFHYNFEEIPDQRSTKEIKNWDQDKLRDIFFAIKKHGDNPEEYIDLHYSVSEEKFNYWPEHIKNIFKPARINKEVNNDQRRF